MSFLKYRKSSSRSEKANSKLLKASMAMTQGDGTSLEPLWPLLKPTQCPLQVLVQRPSREALFHHVPSYFQGEKIRQCQNLASGWGRKGVEWWINIMRGFPEFRVDQLQATLQDMLDEGLGA